MIDCRTSGDAEQDCRTSREPTYKKSARAVSAVARVILSLLTTLKEELQIEKSSKNFLVWNTRKTKIHVQNTRSA